LVRAMYLSASAVAVSTWGAISSARPLPFYLWNQLPSSFRQPHCVHSPGSPHPAHITSSQSSPPFSPSITPSIFHSRLKTHLFHKKLILSSIVTLIASGLPSRILTCTELKGHWRLFVLVSGYVCQIKLNTQLSSPR